MEVGIKQKVLNSFHGQKVMDTIGASILSVEYGRVEIALPFHPSLTQQHGFLHAGIVTTVMDSACGYAALSTMPPDAGVLTVEFKVNLLAPARGTRFKAGGKTIKTGRNITVTQGELVALSETEKDPDKLVATMTATMMSVYDRKNITH